MANNPYVNKVETADGSTLMDITDTTATTDDVESGKVFYAASGERSVGTSASVHTVTMNGTTYSPTDGDVDLGTVITDISGKKNVQTAKSDPTASGTSATFIDSISQDAQGVITATKKTVRTFTKSGSSAASGLVPAPSTTAGTTKFLREDATWQTALTSHQDISGKKNTQSAVSDPSADGTSVTFIATISQNAQGVISPTKKTVRTFTKSGSSAATGLVPAPSTTAGTTKFLCEDATWKTALTSHQDISGKKNTQTAKSDPSASGISTSFIATISQNAQGVITATKKHVFESFSIPASGSKTFNVGNSFRGMIYVVGGSTDSQDAIMVYSTSSGSIAYTRIIGQSQLGSALTVTTATGTIKIANSKTFALSTYVLVFSGSVS